ncbi:3-oxoacyl-ACP reductase [Pseudothermotoga hypogea DSM 11164 = NBRC 106472]|uniref:3-oxoacyl-ACP reductase n=1 Tax=Pseudothermotoga hypogea DSM 11164 = NBRC 106472 TaxID=1123384 RepID=A0A0X1KSI1_9THEM|nr:MULTISPECIES: SDR family oxidoreductase [Pseudothermotoga]AJC74276.1 3-oxoacyl-ACP reductase [Pseudothermotoga hypogea DSM 11164 = NBRC 106472]MBC7123024.1 SDR family oxidoreductase [Pseudothermotoga sp.]MDI6862181.1 SDR family oxidoreductase [Pseudothermotoga sp.]
MDLKLSGKRVLVCGGTRGIGRAIAEEFSKEGSTVFIVARHQSKEIAKQIEVQYSAKVFGFDADLSKAEDIQQVKKAVGQVDVLIINSGGPKVGDFFDLRDEDWYLAFDLLIMSTVRLINAFLPDMIERKWGRVIAITSVSVFEPLPRLLLSNSLRMAIAGLMKSLSKEYARYNITFNCVAPGHTMTERLEHLIKEAAVRMQKSEEEVIKQMAEENDVKRFAKPEEIAAAVVFLASERASYITGTTLKVDGGFVHASL